ncbi:YaeQ family protein [Lolliginicoccus suaedae]|uniref:YaeQ family protein n=1 Tax=Lolliginicoccus suaedae TaxID=2605429 RepID=UPI0011ED6050|nr:YaeQ family protein [Lolliginicoccus suaedae]
MASGTTMHSFTVQLADVDRGLYEQLELRLARHPSETAAFMVTRLLAYCLEYREGITFSDGGVSSADEPAVLVRDLTGRLVHWVEVGAPDAERVHRGSKRAGSAAIYTHHDPARVLAQLAGKRIHQAETIPLHSFDRSFIDAVAALVERRNDLALSITEQQLFLELNGSVLESPVIEHRLA